MHTLRLSPIGAAPLARVVMTLAPILIGWLALYLPTYVKLSETLWQQEAYEHGPLILGIFAWLLWRLREGWNTPQFQARAVPMPWAGATALAIGFVLYYLGRTLNLALFEVGSQLPVAIGIALMFGGTAALRLFWFPLLFLLFMIPLPPFVILAVTGQLKELVSAIAETLLYHAGYPIARNGVVITVGQYQMLVADACSGMNSIYSLSAMGLLYLYLMQRPSILHNAIMLASIVPIAFAANIVRVIVLILLTYHFGDEAGQGFLHGAAGMFLFVVALVCLFLLDRVLTLILRRRA